ncbi:MAG: bifunctional diaminohydroxyphosphoribosylaminopyrimidine deaminase/5-amino-6-(5-phosphoribosylamino)uracil reductase RibD, partial [bacterium]
MTNNDEHYMRMAFTLAKKGVGYTSPNPIVGAVIVKGNTVVAKGYHHKAGAAHAEIDALKKAGDKAEGACLYINLEPCCHQGKTGSCVEAIIKRKVARVVIAMPDPNPLVNGQGIKQLKKVGIEVTVGVLQSEAERLNEIFIKYITTGLPFVILKVALTLDGKIATKHRDVQDLNTDECKQALHELRNQVDATLVGIGTILRNNPQLTTRLVKHKASDPDRIIIDSLLKVPVRANIFTQKSAARNIIVTTRFFSPGRREEIEKAGATVWEIDSFARNKINLRSLVHTLGKKGYTSLMIEGGAEISASALMEGIVDKAVFL